MNEKEVGRAIHLPAGQPSQKGAAAPQPDKRRLSLLIKSFGNMESASLPTFMVGSLRLTHPTLLITSASTTKYRPVGII